jgi:hypothetical protein
MCRGGNPANSATVTIRLSLDNANDEKSIKVSPYEASHYEASH